MSDRIYNLYESFDALLLDGLTTAEAFEEFNTGVDDENNAYYNWYVDDGLQDDLNDLYYYDLSQNPFVDLFADIVENLDIDKDTLTMEDYDINITHTDYVSSLSIEFWFSNMPGTENFFSLLVPIQHALTVTSYDGILYITFIINKANTDYCNKVIEKLRKEYGKITEITWRYY